MSARLVEEVIQKIYSLCSFWAVILSVMYLEEYGETRETLELPGLVYCALGLVTND
jgi:hypothetical protein